MRAAAEVPRGANILPGKHRFVGTLLPNARAA